MEKSVFFKHYLEVPKSVWRWGGFSPSDIACKCNHRTKCEGHESLIVNFRALDNLQKLISHINKPFIIRKAYVSPEHNAKVAGSKNSKHILGIAFDIELKELDIFDLDMAARNMGFRGRGHNKAFIHLDCRDAETIWQAGSQTSHYWSC